MSHWGEVFLGVIAVATLATSVILVALLVAAQELKPVFGHVNAIARDTARAASLAAAQVERADRLFTDLTRRVDETLGAFQNALTGPIRAGAPLSAALMTFRTVFALVRDLRARRKRSRAEEEDALFI